MQESHLPSFDRFEILNLAFFHLFKPLFNILFAENDSI